MTAEPLLATKLFIPTVRPKMVDRPHLTRQLALSGLAPVTLVCGPAGYGKSTLVAASLAQTSPTRPVAWLSLDEGDNDPIRFCRYVVAALRQMAPKLGDQPLALLHSPQPASLSLVLTLLINELAAQDAPLVLVLDDYHVINQQAIHEAVIYMLDHRPPALHLVLISRTDPPLPLARLRVRGELREIRAAALRFSAAETATFMQQVMELPLTAAAIEALEVRTEGWIAGLQLAALSMEGMDDLPAFVEAFSGSHRHLVDYLTEEVLARQPAAVQRFLLYTAPLERFCAPLCEAVLPETAAADPPSLTARSHLEYLDRANLFLIPLDLDGHWFRYHHLFADLLRLRATTLIDDEARDQIHQRAAAWFASQQAWPEAIHHALSGRAFDLAGELIGQQAAGAIARGEISSLQGWLASLPPAQIEASTRLRLAQAWVDLFSNRLDSAEACLAPLLNPAPSGEHLGEEELGEVLAVRATLAFVRGAAARSKEDTERALAYLPANRLSLRTLLVWHLAYNTRALGETELSLAHYREAIDMSRRSGNFLINLNARRELAETLLGQGRLAEAQSMLLQLLEEAAGGGWSELYPIAGAHIHLGEIYYEWNQLEPAITHLQQGSAHPQAAMLGLDSYGQALLAWALAAQGERAAAAEAIAAAERAATQSAHPLRRVLTLAQICHFWLAQGDTERAARWLPDGRELPQDPRHEIFARQQLARGFYLLATGDTTAASQLVAELRPAAEASGRIRDVVSLLLLQARAASGATAETAAGRALLLAEPAGLLRTFLDHGAPLIPILNRLATMEHGPEVYLRKILAALTPRPLPPANRLLVEPLSERELEVLQLMAAGFSNREIADTLTFTIATAKKHAEHIYGKLGVNSRTQAIARARELDLL